MAANMKVSESLRNFITLFCAERSKCGILILLLLQNYIISSAQAHQVASTTHNHQTNKTDSCFFIERNRSGNLTVPNKYLQPGSSFQCEWIINPLGNKRIVLHFLELDIHGKIQDGRCLGAFLQYGIFDTLGRRVIIDEICGDRHPNDFLSIKNKIWLKYYHFPFKEGRPDVDSPFLVVFKAVNNDHLRNTTIVITSVGCIVALIIMACIICYCNRKKKKNVYYHKRQQQKRQQLKKIRKRTGLQNCTPSGWKRKAFRRNADVAITMNISQIRHPGDDDSHSTAITSLATSLKFKPDAETSSREDSPRCMDATKYEEVSDYPDGLKTKTPTTGAVEDEHIYLSFAMEKSFHPNKSCHRKNESYKPKNESYPPEYESFRQSDELEYEQNLCDATYLTVMNNTVVPVSKDMSTIMPKKPTKSTDSSYSGTSRYSPCFSSCHQDRVMSCTSVDSAFQRVTPLFHSTPDLDLVFDNERPAVNIPVIRINDKLVSGTQGKFAPKTYSAPDVGKELNTQMNCASATFVVSPNGNLGQRSASEFDILSSRSNSILPATPVWNGSFLSKSELTLTDSCKSFQLDKSVIRPRPKGLNSPVLSHGQILPIAFTPKPVNGICVPNGSVVSNGFSPSY